MEQWGPMTEISDTSDDSNDLTFDIVAILCVCVCVCRHLHGHGHQHTTCERRAQGEGAAALGWRRQQQRRERKLRPGERLGQWLFTIAKDLQR